MNLFENASAEAEKAVKFLILWNFSLFAVSFPIGKINDVVLKFSNFSWTEKLILTANFPKIKKFVGKKFLESITLLASQLESTNFFSLCIQNLKP